METSARDLIQVRVRRKWREATDVFSFELAHANGDKLPQFNAGSHIDVHVRPGLVRQYSLCNDPSERDRYLIAVLREPSSRGGSRAMHDDVNEGDLLAISAPRNLFPMDQSAQRSLLLAGGIGVTPILCMAEQLSRENASFAMHYCTRSQDRAAFRERIRGAPFSDKVALHFDDAPAAQRFDAGAALQKPEPGLHLYVCGPTGFMNWVIDSATAAGWSEAQIHREYFNATRAETSGDQTFDIKIASTGTVLRVPPGKSVLDVLTGHGLAIQTSCEQGICGTCVTRVIEGIPEHRDMFLTERERSLNDCFTPCCSRAVSKLLVLDL